MKRNTWLIAIAAVAAFFLILNPFQRFRNRNPTVRLPVVPQEDLAAALQFAEADWKSPGEYLAGLFETHDVVFLGEFSKIKEQVGLVSSVLPALYAEGVRTLAIEYALSDDQSRIDALLSSPSWDEEEARRITFDWVVTWGFQEYIDIYKAAWQLDRSLAPGASPLRIVALNVRQNWELIKTDGDLQNKETLHKVLANGIPDEHMADVLLREVVQKGEKALVYTVLQRAFTRYRSKDYEKNMTANGFTEVRRVGNIISDRIGERAFTVALHSPWPDASQTGGLAYPVDGEIDTMLSMLPDGKQSGGWDTVGTALGALAIRSGSYLSGYKSLTLADLCDGYIALGPITSYHAATPIKDFVPADQADYAVRNYPAPKPQGLDAAMVQQAITGEASAIEDALRRFQ